MMKDILELLLKLGWDIPNWLIITLFVLVVIGIICVIIKKNIVFNCISGYPWDLRTITDFTIYNGDGILRIYMIIV